MRARQMRHSTLNILTHSLASGASQVSLKHDQQFQTCSKYSKYDHAYGYNSSAHGYIYTYTKFVHYEHMIGIEGSSKCAGGSHNVFFAAVDPCWQL